jgi:hypothetical protein
MTEKTLLQEYIRRVLREESSGDSGGGYGYDYGYGGGFGGGGGGGFGSTSDLKNALITPFTDVLKVLSGKSKEIVTSVAYLATLALTTTLNLLTLGYISQNYERISSYYSSTMSRIRSEYASAVSINNILKSNDAMFAAFMYMPGLFMLIKPAARRFFEAKMLSESEAEEKLESISSRAQAETDKFFEDIKQNFARLMQARTVAELNMDQQTLTAAEKDLSEIEDPQEKKMAEIELVKTLQAKVLKHEITKLRQEREKIVKSLQKYGVPSTAIFDPEGLVARYENEIKELVRIGSV